MAVTKSVAITGALGNLGQKLLHHLAGQGVPRLVGLDVRPPAPNQADSILQAAAEHGHQPQVEFIQANLAAAGDSRWREAIEAAAAVVHFAAQNPYPEATWGDSAASFDMTLNVALASAASPNVSRFVFATSNHVMGRYKDSPLAETIGPGQLHPNLEAGVGTVWHTGQTEMDSTAYAVAKFSGERLCRALSRRPGNSTTFVCVRIGWCQPGENRPDTISASGSPTLGSDSGQLDADTLARTERWFKGMWLSNRDFLHLFERAIEADSADWPEPCIIVNGMSNNSGMAWSLDETRRWLGYEPQDDVTRG